MGNILSVMGVVNENLKARNKKLSIETVFGPKEQRKFFKNILNPKGDAGPDIKQGIKAGVLGGMIGVLFNIPAGTILSMPEASILSRSVIGGIGAAGSAVAIPPVMRSTKVSFEKSIRALETQGKIHIPKAIKEDPTRKRQYIEKMALKELNARIGMASSIKATHPIPLAGTGGLILAGEKLGIPREYVQTAYMALAPVMHNFLRLIYTGVEKYWTIPQRMKKLQKLVYETQDRPFNQSQLKKLDNTFLGKSDRILSQGLSNMGYVLTAGGILLGAEVLYFLQVLKNKKTVPVLANQPYNKIVIPAQYQPPIWTRATSASLSPFPQLPALPGASSQPSVSTMSTNPFQNTYGNPYTISLSPVDKNPYLYAPYIPNSVYTMAMPNR
jgi:hypothetical protein